MAVLREPGLARAATSWHAASRYSAHVRSKLRGMPQQARRHGLAAIGCQLPVIAAPGTCCIEYSFMYRVLYRDTHMLRYFVILKCEVGDVVPACCRTL